MVVSLQRLAFLMGAIGFLSACAMVPSPPSASPTSASPTSASPTSAPPPSASPPASPSQTEAWRPPQPASLLGSRWKLVAFQSMDDAQGTVRPDAPERYMLHFESATRVAVRLDCNRGAGSWSWEPGPSTQAGEPVRGGLRLGAIALTRMACPPGSLDSRIGRQLEFVRGFVLDGDRLTLSLMADGGLLHFMRE